MSRLINLIHDGIVIEVDSDSGESKLCTGPDSIKQVDSSFTRIKPILSKICESLSETFNGLSDKIQVESAEVSLSLNFEAEGGIFITKAKASSNLDVKLIIKSKKCP